MRTPRFLINACLCAWVTASGSAWAQPAQSPFLVQSNTSPTAASPSPIKPKLAVKVYLDKIAPDRKFVERFFYANTSVINVGKSDAEVLVWTQPGWSWLSNNKDFIPGIEALKNAPSKIVLKPGEELSRKVEIWTTQHPKKHNFKLGFVPFTEKPVSGIHDESEVKRLNVYWSNSVTYK